MRSRRRPGFHIEVAPVNLIDLVLILLVFFITTTTFLTMKFIDMKLPEAKTAGSHDKTLENVVINIDNSGTLFIDKRQTDFEQLRGEIVSRANSNVRFCIGADMESKHADFVRVLDLLRANGIRDIAILARKG